MREAESLKRAFSQLYVQVLAGMLIGILVGLLWPQAGAALKPLADAFVKLIKMLLAPIIFGTVAVGIARMGSLKDVGRLGLKALVYFEILSSIALVVGLLVANVVKPGAGMHVDARALDAGSLAAFKPAGDGGGIAGFLLHIIPNSFLGAFTDGNMLQVILLAVLFGLALSAMGEAGRAVNELADQATHVLFRIVGMVMRLAPVGAGAGMAFTIGEYGLGTLWSLGALLLCLYLTTLIFILLVLGSVARMAGIPFFAFLKFIRAEILVVLGSCSTEAVLPEMMRKLEQLGCARPVVGMVLPAGYTFNTDGTCIYLTMAAIFIAQATDTPLTVMDQLTILAVLLLTSKGSAGVAGAGFVTLSATLSAIPAIPVAGIVLILGVDRFLNEARAVTNLIGNGVATLAIARWDGALDVAQARAVLDGGVPAEQEPSLAARESET